jgi:hypothetical protein
MLTEFQSKLWKEYVRAESRATRAEKLLALETFLDALLVSPSSEWFAWARSLATQVVDQGAPLVIRQPLFRRAVFPALLAGYRNRLPGCARWLAGLANNLQRCPECLDQFLPEDATELGLLRAAISHDPLDHRSRLRLIDKLAEFFRFTLHEVPSGILYGMDGATAEQCLKLEKELTEFCQLVAEEQIENRFADLISSCRFHFRAYRGYLLNRERYEDT